MKKIVSISLGSSSRNHVVRHELLGEMYEISRIGVNGNIAEALSLYKQLDGSVDAFGLGGTGFYAEVGGKRYPFRDAEKIRASVVKSKLADGSMLKGILEGRAFFALERELNNRNQTLRGLPALQTSGVERYQMARAMKIHGLEVVWGDLIFALGLPIPIRSLSGLKRTAALLMPIVGKFPFHWLYPLGAEQDRPPQTRWDSYYNSAAVIAGDYLQIRQYLPDDLTGKIIVTNTTTLQDVGELRKRNLYMLVTVTPRMSGRSFGTNVMEAVLMSMIDKPQCDITEADLLEQVERVGLKPSIETLS